MGKLRKLRNRLLGQPDVDAYRARGCNIGAGVHLGPGVRLDPSHCWLITLGDEATLGPGVLVLAHDGSIVKHLGVNYIAPVSIGARAFLGAGTIVMPGVSIGADVVIGSGSVVTGDIPDGSVAVGVPAKVIGTTKALVDKHRTAMRSRPVYGLEDWTTEGGIDSSHMAVQAREAHSGAYVEAVRGSISGL